MRIALESCGVRNYSWAWCVAAQIDSGCHAPVSDSSSSDSQRQEPVVTSGFVSSPNYPRVYAMTADCRWTLTVQPSQTLQLTLYDFELTVKTDSICRDYLRITAVTLTSAGSEVSGSEVTVFEDCGSRGLQVFDIASSRVHLHFHTDQSSQTHRGFLIHYTGTIRYDTMWYEYDTVD